MPASQAGRRRFEPGRPRFLGDCGVTAASEVVILAVPVRIRSVALRFLNTDPACPDKGGVTGNRRFPASGSARSAAANIRGEMLRYALPSQCLAAP